MKNNVRCVPQWSGLLDDLLVRMAWGEGRPSWSGWADGEVGCPGWTLALVKMPSNHNSKCCALLVRMGCGLGGLVRMDR